MESKDKIVVINSTGKNTEDCIFKFVNTLDKKQICYVSISKEVTSLRDLLSKKGFNIKDMYFIDCISKTLTNPKNDKNCVFVSSPNALTELSIAINKFMESSSIIIFDSLSSLSIYHKPNMIVRFVNSLIQKSKKNPDDILILPIQIQHKKTEWYNLIVNLADKVID